MDDDHSMNASIFLFACFKLSGRLAASIAGKAAIGLNELAA